MTEQDAWFHRMKAAQRDLIARCGGIVRAAGVAKISPAQMGRLNNPNYADLMTARVKAALEADAQAPVITAIELELLGWGVHRVEAAPAAGDLHQSTSRVVAEASDLMRSYADAMKDGRMCVADIRTMMDDFAALIRVAGEAQNAGSALIALHRGLRHD